MLRSLIAFVLVGCAPHPVEVPDLAATPLPVADASADVQTGITDPFGGNPPPERIPIEAGPDTGIPKCVDHKHEGFGSSGGACGSTMRYRCGVVRYEVECSGDLARGAVCTCLRDGRVTNSVSQPLERCGNTSKAREACGFPTP